MGRVDTSRIDVHDGITVDAGVSVLDELEDVYPSSANPKAMDRVIGVNRGAAGTGNNCRRRLEDKLEELRLQRQISDYSFRLH